ncbi:MAG: NAD(P)-binding domain-containing protein [Euryarchaeota archaeon]|nr:NAD(P)-binding domain-containing protein [Euryarchaeota archaeon]
MYIIVIGGGRIGEYLIDMLVEEGHDVALIETNAERANHMAENYDILVIKGDGGEAKYLEDAGIHKADVLVACTGSDQINFVACQLAKSTYSVPKVIARTTNPSNKIIYEKLGVDVVVSTTEASAKAIYAGIKGFSAVLTFSGDVELISARVTKTSPVANRKINEIHLPWGSILAAILRDGEIRVPTEDMRIQEGDEIVIINKKGVENKVRDLIAGK